MCTNCNQNSNTPCGCNDGVYQEVNICNQCPPEQPCDCPVKDLSTDCVLYNQEDISCKTTIVVPKNTNLSVALLLIVKWACTRFEEMKTYFRLLNIGIGAEIYAGNTLIGEKKLRKINSNSPLVTVVQNTNDISIGADTNAIIALQKKYVVANIGTGEGVYKDVTILGNNVQFNLKKLNQSSPIVTVVPNTDDISIGINNDEFKGAVRKYQRTYEVLNVGTGEGIYKNKTELDNYSEFNFKKLKSDSLSIATSTDGNTLRIEQINYGVKKFRVNSEYTGTEELGTIQKPFKNLQNAINKYIGGVGFTNKNPENEGVEIVIEKDTNIFTGSLAIRGLRLELEGNVTLVCNPAYGQYIADVDSNATLPPGYIPFTDTEQLQIRINRKETTSAIVCMKQGFKNRGTTTTAGQSNGKLIYILGKGIISITQDSDTSTPSNRCIIEANKENLTGYYNDNNTGHFGLEGRLITNNTRLVICGLNSKVYSDTGEKCTYAFNNDASTAYNTDTTPIEINGGSMLMYDTTFESYNRLGYHLRSFVKISDGSFVGKNGGSIGQCDSVFENTGTAQPCLKLSTSYYNFAQIKFISSPNVLWANVDLKNNEFSGKLLETEVKLRPGSINHIDDKVVETLNKYNNRADAISNGLYSGCKFINTGGVASPTTGWFIDIIM